TIDSGEIWLSLDNPNITNATPMLPANAAIEIKIPPLCEAPAFRPIIANAAPKLAPCDTPRVDADARGLSRIACKTHPTTPSPAPATSAVQIRGSRTLRTTTLILGLLALPATPRNNSFIGVS